MIDHKTITSGECHETLHIVSGTHLDVGKVLTPSSTQNGVSVYRRIKYSELQQIVHGYVYRMPTANVAQTRYLALVTPYQAGTFYIVIKTGGGTATIANQIFNVTINGTVIPMTILSGALDGSIHSVAAGVGPLAPAGAQLNFDTPGAVSNITDAYIALRSIGA